MAKSRKRKGSAVEEDTEEAAPTEEVAPAPPPLVRDGSVGSFLRSHQHLMPMLTAPTCPKKSEIDMYEVIDSLKTLEVQRVRIPLTERCVDGVEERDKFGTRL